MTSFLVTFFIFKYFQAWKELIENKEESQPATEDSNNAAEDKINSESNSTTQETPLKENGEILTMDDSNSMPMNIDDIPMPTNEDSTIPNSEEINSNANKNDTDSQVVIENSVVVNEAVPKIIEPVPAENLPVNNVKNLTPKNLTPVTNSIVNTPPTPGKVINSQIVVNKVFNC